MFQFGTMEKFEIFLLVSLFGGLFNTLIMAVWAYLQTPKINNIDHSDNENITLALWQLRKYTFGFSALALSSLFAVLICAGTIDDNPFTLMPYPFLNLFIIGHIQFSLERKLRSINLKWFHAILTALRAIGAMAFFQAAYLGLSTGLTIAANPIMQTLGVHPSVRHQLQEPISFIFNILSLGTMIYFSPVMVRLMLPSKRLNDAKIESMLRSCFHDAKIPVPRFFTLELDKMKNFNALVTGFSWGKGPASPSLYFSKGLLQNLTELEFKSIMQHEIGHIALKHMKKRTLLSMLTIFGLIFLLIPAELLVVVYFSKEVAFTVGFCGYLILMGLQIFMVRRQVRLQEMEADAYAVFELGASIADFESAMRKLSALNNMPFDQKDIESYFSATAAHPTPAERIRKLQMRAKLKRQGKPLFHHSEWYKDLFEGRWKYVTTIFIVIFLVSSGVLLKKVMPAHMMYKAASSGDLEAIHHLLNDDGNINGPDLFAMGQKPLHAAIDANQIEVISYLIANGANFKVKKDGDNSFLSHAAREGKLEVVNLLLNKNVDPNEPSLQKIYPLIYAAAKGHVEIVKTLLEYGAKIDLPDSSGNTALLIAAERGHLEIVKILITKGANINARNEHGSNPLLMASYYGNTAIAKFLVTQHALLDELDGNGDSALAMANAEDFKELKEVLQIAGAKIDRRQSLKRQTASTSP